MAAGAVQRNPYDTVLEICRWAAAQWPWLDGRALLAGVDIETLPARRFIHVVVAYMRERGMETKEEVEVHNKMHGAILESILRGSEEAVDDPAAPFPGLRERPMVG